MLKKLHIFCIFSLTTFLSLFASLQSVESYHVREINDQVIEELVAENDSSISSIENQTQVYLNSQHLIASEDGLFLQTGKGEQIRLSFLYSNENGCFILTGPKEENDGVVYPMIKCWNCRTPFNPNVYNKGRCPKCNAQN